MEPNGVKFVKKKIKRVLVALDGHPFVFLQIYVERFHPLNDQRG